MKILKPEGIKRDVKEIDWQKWEPNMRATLLFVKDNNRVLLIKKKRGLGAGKINGPGGKLDEGETSKQAAIREVQEELLITPHDPKYHGLLNFQFIDGLALKCWIYVSKSWEGEPTETDEAIPMWFDIDKIPYDKMWDDDILWLPRVLKNGDKFTANFIFDDEEILSHEIMWE